MSGRPPVEAGRPTIAVRATIVIIVGGKFVGDVFAAGRESGVHRLHVRVVEIVAGGGAARGGSAGLGGQAG